MNFTKNSKKHFVQSHKKHLAVTGMITVGALLSACPAFAGQASAEFVVQPQAEKIDAQEVWYEVVYTSGTNATAGAAFYFDVAENYKIKTVIAGTGVDKSEISFRADDGKLNLLYLDNDAGGSVPEKGAQLFQICITGNFDKETTPLSLKETDVSAILENNDIIDVETTMKIQSVGGSSDKSSPSSAASEVDSGSKKSESHSSSKSESSSQNPASNQTISSSTTEESVQTNPTLPKDDSQLSRQSSNQSKDTSEKPQQSFRNVWLGVIGAVCVAAVGAFGYFAWKNKNQ